MIRWPSEEARAWVAQLLVDAAADVVVVYGSAVRDVPGSNDVDLLVVSKSRPEYAPPLDVDLHWVDARQLESSVAAGDEVLGWALRFGIPLLDRGGDWVRLVKDWSGRLVTRPVRPNFSMLRRAIAAAAGLISVAITTAFFRCCLPR